MSENTSYYAVIPANVRYAKIPANAKLLYWEITALANKEGFCWASNAYFAELYEVSKSTVSEWVSILAKNGFIDVEIAKKEDGTPIRKIYIGIRKKTVGYTEKAEGGYTGKAEHNNTSINNTSNNTFPDFSKEKVGGRITKKEKEELEQLLQDIILSYYTLTDKKARFTSSLWEKFLKTRIKLKLTENSTFREAWNIAIENYEKDIQWRFPWSEYYSHRFSLAEFLKQENGFEKFYNK